MVIAIDARSLEQPKTGVGRYLSNLIKYWKSDREHRFIFYFKDAIPESDLIKSENFSLKLLKNPLGFSSNLIFQHFLLPYHIKKDKADFFFSPFYIKPIYCPAKSSIVLHDISYEVHPEWFDPRSQFILKKLSKLSAKSSSIIFTISNFSKNEIIEHYNIEPDKIKVVSLAPDESFSKIEDISKINEIKNKYGIKNKYIFCVGSIFTRRHIPEILEAFERIAENSDECQLFLVGKNYTYPFVDMEKIINKVNLGAKRQAILHSDFIQEEDLMILYSACEAVIYLSDYEGFGLPIVEAQFFGKPVVTSRNSSLIEVGQNAVIFVERNTAGEIFEAIKRIAQDSDFKEELIKRGYENIKRFSWKKCANETLEAIKFT